MAESETARPEEAEAPKLDDLMMAMDVVDTLRHQDTLVERELGQEERDVALKERLRGIYESQGLEVTDRVLNQGIAALREQRFSYEKRGSGFGRFLALMWVRRAPVGAALAALLVLIVGVVAWTSWQRAAEERAIAAAQVELMEVLPAELSRAGQAALSEARDIGALAEVEGLIADGEAALGRSDAEAARAAVGELEGLRDRIVQSYELRIVSRPGEQTGVFRVPDVNTAARNYYLIVEAITPDGDVLSLPITSEEDGTTETVSIFAVRVPRETYDAVANDKRADGIVDDNRLGEKRRGSLDETYLMNAEDGRIRQW